MGLWGIEFHLHLSHTGTLLTNLHHPWQHSVNPIYKYIYHCINYLVIMTTNVRYYSFRAHCTCGVHWLKKFQAQLSSINSLTIHQSASRTPIGSQWYTSTFAAIYWRLFGSELDNSQHMAGYELMCVGQQTSVWLVLWSLVELWGGWWMINVFGNFFNQIIQLLNACMEPETAVTCTHGHLNQSVYMPILDIAVVPNHTCSWNQITLIIQPVYLLCFINLSSSQSSLSNLQVLSH